METFERRRSTLREPHAALRALVRACPVSPGEANRLPRPKGIFRRGGATSGRTFRSPRPARPNGAEGPGAHLSASPEPCPERCIADRPSQLRRTLRPGAKGRAGRAVRAPKRELKGPIRWKLDFAFAPRLATLRTSLIGGGLMSRELIGVFLAGSGGRTKNGDQVGALLRPSGERFRLGAIALALTGLCCSAHAQTQVVIPSGLPVQVVPKYPEVGAPNFSFPSGSSTDVGGTGTTGDTGGSGSTGSGGTTLPANATLTQVAQQDFIQAAAAATGITPEALAATCMAESNCQNVGAASGSSASGEFQMINSTYQAMIDQFAANNPGISVDTSLAGKMDPTNEAYAAAQYLADGVQALQAAGDASPTNVDLRGYYQFGAGLGAQIANAQPNQSLESIVQLTPSCKSFDLI